MTKWSLRQYLILLGGILVCTLIAVVDGGQVYGSTIDYGIPLFSRRRRRCGAVGLYIIVDISFTSYRVLSDYGIPID